MINAIAGYLADNPLHGLDKLYAGGRHYGIGKCRPYRVYKTLRQNIRRRGKRRLPARINAPLVVPTRSNEIWSADFTSDAQCSRRRLRTFNALDDCNREAVAIEIDSNLPAARIVRALEQAAA